MGQPSRGAKISRRSWLLAGLAAPFFRARAENSLIVTFDGDNLHISSLGIHFLKDNSLRRLKDGSTMVYIATVSLFHDPFVSQIKRLDFKFIVSYDVWGAGDQFHIIAPGPPARRADNLSQSASETWCFENMLVPTQGIPRDRQFWLQLDLRTAIPKLSSVLGESSLFLDFIELLSPGVDERQTSRTGPLRLIDLDKKRRAG